MKRFFKVLKWIGLTLGSLVLVLAIVVLIFVNTSPQFGGKPNESDKKRFEASGHYTEGKFENLVPTSLDYSFSNMVSVMKDYMKGNPNKNPESEPPVLALDVRSWKENSEDGLMWFGHSAILIKLQGKHILLDPMLGKSPSPHPWFGPGRYSKKLPVEIEELPDIDLVIISHDHYDHLDYGSILKLKAKTKMFFVPLGVGAHLLSWGIEQERIQELNWWDESTFEGIDLAFLPSRHFSGRGLFTNNTTLWGSWLIKGLNTRIYFSGDGGYGPHFKEIGEKYGPFDLALVECGQYNEHWSQIHMMPEETAQAAADVKAKAMMPIHWGAFTLAMHDWNEPAVVSTERAEQLGLQLIIPKIGQVVPLDSIRSITEKWW